MERHMASEIEFAVAPRGKSVWIITFLVVRYLMAVELLPDPSVWGRVYRVTGVREDS
jgi:hypothetical protein